MYSIAYYESPLGVIELISDGKALTGLRFLGRDHNGPPIKKDGNEKDDLPVFGKTSHWLDIYFTGIDPGFVPPLSLTGSSFQLAVWSILLKIPFGRTMSYGEIADIIAHERGIRKMSAQAVGGAVGRNPVSLIVPCHRVIGSDGSLTGYGGGIERKLMLLKLEGVVTDNAPVKGFRLITD
ncbi:MAG: methylated-DNA--[Eubacteriaceae bacterium]|nr:methylated-DNA--[protein]-cysteine S-methyltransferase [Eubacteriaceae bacterium]